MVEAADDPENKEFAPKQPAYGGESEAARLRAHLAQIRLETPEADAVAVSPRTAAILMQKGRSSAPAWLVCHNRAPDGVCLGHSWSASPTGTSYHETLIGDPGASLVAEECAHPATIITRVCVSCGSVLETAK